MGSQMFDLISQFTSEAKENSSEQNIENLEQLKNLKKEIHNSLSSTSNDRLEGQKEALKMMGLGDVDLGESEPVVENPKLAEIQEPKSDDKMSEIQN